MPAVAKSVERLRTLAQDALTQPTSPEAASAEDGASIAAAIHAAAAGLNNVAAAIGQATAQREPVDQFFGHMTDVLGKISTFLKKRGPWLLGLTPGVLVAIGAITPNAAKAVAAVLKALGAP